MVNTRLHICYSKMHLIYRGAKATILATTGIDANAGLPGVRPGSRKLVQHIEEVKPRVKLTVVEGLFDHLKGSYTDRGWT